MASLSNNQSMVLSKHARCTASTTSWPYISTTRLRAIPMGEEKRSSTCSEQKLLSEDLDKFSPLPYDGYPDTGAPWQFSSSGLASPQSLQSEIVGTRSGAISQWYGQITPPDEHVSDSSCKPDFASDTKPDQSSKPMGKLTKEQRARNAANHRHQKVKKSCRSTDDVSDGDDRVVGSNQDKSLSSQREKNRVAAAKCRAKKKADNEIRQEAARAQAANHNYLVREVRELRDERSRLRSLILAHNSQVCNCEGIHHFNNREATKLIHGAQGQTAPTQSPFSESDQSRMLSPISDASVEMTLPREASMVFPVGTDAFPKGPPFKHSDSHATSDQIGDVEQPYRHGRRRLPQAFTDFSHS